MQESSFSFELLGFGSYQALVEKDLELIWSIQDFIYKRPWLDRRLAAIVSKYPWNDVVMLVWLSFGLGLMLIGAKHFWLCATNLALSFVLRKILASKRPVEYDVRLQPMTDLHADSFGFPSLESYMSVIIALNFHQHFPSWSLYSIPVMVFVISIVGFSRVYTRARFPHQVVFSWAVAFLGYLLTDHCCERMSLHTLQDTEHFFCLLVVGVIALTNLALNMENNDSRLLHVPKKEFVRVLSGIINSSKSKADGGEDLRAIVEQNRQIAETPRAAAARRAAASSRTFRLGKETKRDSFYYLQKTLERRAAESGRSGGGGEAGYEDEVDGTPRSKRGDEGGSKRNSGRGASFYFDSDNAHIA